MMSMRCQIQVFIGFVLQKWYPTLQLWQFFVFRIDSEMVPISAQDQGEIGFTTWKLVLEKDTVVTLFLMNQYQYNNIQSYFVMKATIQQFLELRVYKDVPFSRLVNLMVCNRCMKFPVLVSNANKIYHFSSRFLGKTLVNWTINNTFCKALTAGNSIPQADQIASFYRYQGIPVILDYCAEGHLAIKELEATLDANAALFAQSAKHLVENKNEMTSIKITGLFDVTLLRKLNDSVNLRDQLWAHNSQNGKLSAQQLFQGLRKVDPSISEEDVSQYLQTIHHYSGSFADFCIDQVAFKMNHHPFYLFHQAKNEDKIIHAFFPTDISQKQKLKNFRRRINLICEPVFDNQNSFKILVDAEQSYVQKAIESISEQLQERYNKKKIFIIPTIQCYLKSSIKRGLYEIQIAKRKQLQFSAKLVRGAYLVEETKLALQKKRQNPVVDGFDKTTENYLSSFEAMVSAFETGQIVVATHNEDTIQSTFKIGNKYEKKPLVSYAQLLGLADHLTWKLNAQNRRVYKLLPWAQTEVMVSYMIRRAEELSQMRYPLDIQNALVKHELKQRLRL